MKIWAFTLVCFVMTFAVSGTLQASSIHDAVQKGDLAKVKTLLKNHPELLNDINEDEDTPLHMAAMFNQVQIASYLIDKGASLTSMNADGFTPLQYAAFLHKTNVAQLIASKTNYDMSSAIMLHNTELVKKLLDSDAKLANTLDSNGDTPLWAAACEGSADIAALLVEYGADVNAEGKNGAPLPRAVAEGHKEVVKLLLDNGANPNRTDRSDMLSMTMYPNRPEIAKLLLAKGAKVSIFYATFTQDIDKVRELLDSNSDLVNAEMCWEPYTPLHTAADRNAKEIVNLLIERGANINSRYSGITPLYMAVASGSKDVVSFLISKGAKVNFPGSMVSVLNCAVEHNQGDIAKLLIAKGAKIDAKDDNGSTPLIIAAKQGNKELAALLIKNGAKVNTKDNCGATALGWAIGKHCNEVAALLKKKGGKKILPPQKILKEGFPPQCDPLYMD